MPSVLQRKTQVDLLPRLCSVCRPSPPSPALLGGEPPAGRPAAGAPPPGVVYGLPPRGPGFSGRDPHKSKPKAMAMKFLNKIGGKEMFTTKKGSKDKPGFRNESEGRLPSAHAPVVKWWQCLLVMMFPTSTDRDKI